MLKLLCVNVWLNFTLLRLYLGYNDRVLYTGYNGTSSCSSGDNKVPQLLSDFDQFFALNGLLGHSSDTHFDDQLFEQFVDIDIGFGVVSDERLVPIDWPFDEFWPIN